MSKSLDQAFIVGRPPPVLCRPVPSRTNPRDFLATLFQGSILERVFPDFDPQGLPKWSQNRSEMVSQSDFGVFLKSMVLPNKNHGFSGSGEV